MKTTQDCRRWREEVCLRTCGARQVEEAARLETHLANCADCRHYAEELRAATVGLRRLAGQQVDPSPGFRARWTQAVEDAARPRGFGETTAALLAWWRELLLRNLRPALGVASLWVLALLFRLSAPDISPMTQTTVARSPVEIFRALKAPEQLLAGELGEPIRGRDAPQKPNPARPRSEAFPDQPTAQQDRELGRGAGLAGLFPDLTGASVQVRALVPLNLTLSPAERQQTPTARVCVHAVSQHA